MNETELLHWVNSWTYRFHNPIAWTSFSSLRERESTEILVPIPFTVLEYNKRKESLMRELVSVYLSQRKEWIIRGRKKRRRRKQTLILNYLTGTGTYRSHNCIAFPYPFFTFLYREIRESEDERRRLNYWTFTFWFMRLNYWTCPCR